MHQLTDNMIKECLLNCEFSTSSEHVAYINCYECQNKSNKQFVNTTSTELAIIKYWTCNLMNESVVILRVFWYKNKCFWQRYTCMLLEKATNAQSICWLKICILKFLCLLNFFSILKWSTLCSIVSLLSIPKTFQV